MLAIAEEMVLPGRSPSAQGANGQAGGLSRVGGEQENGLQRAGDYLDYLNPFNKSQIQPGTPHYQTAQSAINEMPYGPTRSALLGRLEGGHLYTYSRIFGGAETLTSGGETFISTALLGENPSYVGFQLSHEYFHQLSWGSPAVREESGWRTASLSRQIPWGCRPSEPWNSSIRA
jgi:hypothetical protein